MFIKLLTTTAMTLGLATAALSQTTGGTNLPGVTVPDAATTTGSAVTATQDPAAGAEAAIGSRAASSNCGADTSMQSTGSTGAEIGTTIVGTGSANADAC
jgi:hypothetical protein